MDSDQIRFHPGNSFFSAESHFARVRFPVLAVRGERDTIVPPEASRSVYARALAHNRDVALRIVPGGDHVLFATATGSVWQMRAGFSSARKQFAAGYLGLLVEWLGRRFGPRRAAR